LVRNMGVARELVDLRSVGSRVLIVELRDAEE